MVTAEDVGAVVIFASLSDDDRERLARASADIRLAPGEYAAHAGGEQALFGVLEGTIDFTVGGASHRLHAGDCLASRLDGPTMFHNPTAEDARYAVVTVAEPPSRR